MNRRPHVSFGPWLSLGIAVSSLASVCSCSPTDRLSSFDLMPAETSRDVASRHGHEKQSPSPTSSLAFHSRQKLLGAGVNDADYFGASAAISGDFAFIGADGDDANGLYSGAVYVFKLDNGAYTQTQILRPNDAAIEDLFGLEVAADGDTLVVAASGHSRQFAYSGAAYVFVRQNDTWIQEAQLVASDEQADAAFGAAVSISGDTVLVGALASNDLGPASGAAYVFTKDANGWPETQKLLAGDGAAQDRFGIRLAIEGDTAIVSAPEDDNAAGNNAGSVYVFKRSNGTFSQTQKLASSDLRANDNFGIFGLGLSGNTAVISALGADIGQSSNQGALYVFQRNDGSSNFAQTQKLTAMDGQPGDNLAGAIALQGDTLVATSFLAGVGSNAEQGAGYVFARVNAQFVQQQKIIAVDGAAGDWFGVSAALKDGTLIIGANYHEALGPASGAAYVYALGCSSNAQCASGFCVDDICCDSACGNGDPNDCLACSVIAGAAGDGTCGPVVQGKVCRNASTGFACDVPEVCDGVSTICPPDGVVPANTECRSAVGDCDVAEVCDGNSKSCPVDVKVLPSTECRPAAGGPCDVAEVCDGILDYCPADVKLDSTVTCRPQAGICDVPERCNGDDDACPPDEFASPGIECRASAGVCDVAEYCDGLSAECPPEQFQTADYVCRQQMTACDRAETCTGAAADCPVDAKASAGMECRAAVSICDQAETCDGVSDDCPTDEKVPAGIECRANAGPCDAAETCDGISSHCPPDVKVQLGTICRNATSTCDAIEICDGVSVDCPADENVADGSVCLNGTCSNGTCAPVTSSTGGTSGGSDMPTNGNNCFCALPGHPTTNSNGSLALLVGLGMMAKLRRRK